MSSHLPLSHVLSRSLAFSPALCRSLDLSLSRARALSFSLDKPYAHMCERVRRFHNRMHKCVCVDPMSYHAHTHTQHCIAAAPKDVLLLLLR